jgi:hypothetical protein
MEFKYRYYQSESIDELISLNQLKAEPSIGNITYYAGKICDFLNVKELEENNYPPTLRKSRTKLC